MKLTEILKGQTEGSSNIIAELFIQDGNNEMVKLMTEDVEQVKLHYEDKDDTFRGYFHCLGKECPYCQARFKPIDYVLLPVFSVTQMKICVLRINKLLGPHRLLSSIAPFLTDPKISQMILTITREKNRYQVDAQSMPEYAAVGAEEVAEFVQRVEKGEVNTRSLYPTYTVDELRSVKVVRRKLNILEHKAPDDGIES